MKFYQIYNFLLCLIFYQITYAQTFDFRNYTTDYILFDYQINDDDLWIGTQGGLVYIDKLTLQRELFQPWNSPLKGGGIYSIYKDHSGKHWFGSDHSGLYSKSGSVWEHFYNVDDDIQLRDIRKIVGDSQNNLWISHLNEKESKYELLFYNQTTFTKYNTDIFYSKNVVIDLNDLAWIWNSTSISWCDKFDCFETVFDFTLTEEESITNVTVDKTGQLWAVIQFVDNGYEYRYRLIKYQNNKWVIDQESKADLCEKILVDESNALWFQFRESKTRNTYYINFKNSQWSDTLWSYDLPNMNNEVNYGPDLIKVENDDHFWFRTYGDYVNDNLYEINGKTLRSYDTELDSLIYNYWTKSIFDCDGFPTFVSDLGLQKLKNSEWEILEKEIFGIPFHFYIRDAAYDPNTCDLWLTVWGDTIDFDIIKFNTDTIEYFKANHAYAIAEDILIDNNGAVWITTGSSTSGIGRYQDNEWTWFNSQNSNLETGGEDILYNNNHIYVSSYFPHTIYKYDGETWEDLKINPWLCKMLFNEDDQLILLFRDRAKIYENDQLISEIEDPLGQIEYLRSFTKYKDHSYFVGTSNGLYVWDGNDKYLFFDSQNTNLFQNIIRDVSIDLNDNIYVLSHPGINISSKIDPVLLFEDNETEEEDESTDDNNEAQDTILNSDLVQLYPNPADNMLTISTRTDNGEPFQYDLEIFSSQGNLVYNIKTSKNVIDVSSLETGIYIYRIYLYGDIHTNKLVIYR